MVHKKSPFLQREKMIIRVLRVAIVTLALLFLYQMFVAGGRDTLRSSFLNIPSSTSEVSNTTDISSTSAGLSTTNIPFTSSLETTENPTTSTNNSTTEMPTETKPAPWTPALETDIAGYDIFCGTNPERLEKVETVPSSQYITFVDDLPCDTTYYCSVQAFSNTGVRSEMSAQFSFKTPPCPDNGDTFEPDPTPYPPIFIPPGSDGIDLPVPYPGIPAIKIPPPPSTFDCPPPNIVTAQVSSMKLMYSYDLVNWSEYTVPAEGFDKDKAAEELGIPVFFRVEVVYDYVCIDVSGPPTPVASRLGSSVLQSSSLGDTFVAEDTIKIKESFWSRLMHFFASLFTWDSSGLKSDTLNPSRPSSSAMIVIEPTQSSVSDTSYQPHGNTYGLGKVKITAQGLSADDSVMITGAGFLGIINTPNTPLRMSIPLGAALTVTAITGPNSSFTSWQGCTSTVGKVCTIIVDGNENITSLFEPIKKFTLTTTRAGTGSGTITGMTGTSQIYASGASVTLTAVPAVNSTFVGWGGCTSVSGTSCKVLMTGNKVVTANFRLKTYTLSAIKRGTGSGTLLQGSTAISTKTFTVGTTTSITAIPTSNSIFKGWTGCNSVSGTTCKVTITGNKTITATFTRK